MKKNEYNNFIYEFKIKSSQKDFRGYLKPKELFSNLKDSDICPTEVIENQI